MKRGTVIYYGNFELPDKNAAANRVVNNGKLLRELGFRPVFLGACRTDRYFPGVVKRDFGAGYGGFDMYEQCYPLGLRQWGREIFDIGGLRTLADAYPDAVAVILYNTQYATVKAARRAFAKRGIAVLYDCTEWNSFTEGPFVKRRVKALDSRLIEERLPRVCGGVVAVSRTMEARYAPQTPVLLLPPLVDIADPIWRQTPEKGDRFTFCYAGVPSDKDRLDLLISAFSRLPEGSARLRIIGLTREEYLNAASAPPLPPDVLFLGRKTHAETVCEILSCGCFVFLREPGRRNTAGFPTKFVEAFTCGVPLITTAVSDVPHYADGECAVLPDISPEGVFSAMASVLSSPPPPRALRDTFDYRSFTEAARSWLEKTL